MPWQNFWVHILSGAGVMERPICLNEKKTRHWKISNKDEKSHWQFLVKIMKKMIKKKSQTQMMNIFMKIFISQEI